MSEIQPFIFDFQSFQKCLEDEARTIFSYLKDRYDKDRIYGYGLYAHSDEFEALYPLILTENQLEKSIQERRKRDYLHYRGMSLANLRWYYRYHYESDYYEDQSLWHAFDQSNGLISRGSSSLIGTYIDAQGKFGTAKADALIQPELTRFRSTCINALRQLNKEGIFGKGMARTQIIVMIDYYAYPRDENRGRIIGALNPPEIVDRYRIAMAKASSFDALIDKNIRRARKQSQQNA